MEEMMTPILPNVSARMCRNTPEKQIIRRMISRMKEDLPQRDPYLA